MPIVFFSDIDDTLIQSKKKCSNEDNLTANAVDAQGHSSSYSTPEQQLLINLCNEHTLVPVTGRNKAATDRLSLNHHSFQIIDHGAIVLNEQGAIDPSWAQMLDTQALPWRAILESYLLQIKQLIAQQQLSLRCKLITDFGYACYLSIKGPEKDLAKLSPLTETFCALESRARVHLNLTNMALLPPFACKKRAVLHVKAIFLKRNKETLFIGLGDSTSDLDFMHNCHFQMIPQNSQINREKLQ